MYYRAKLVSTDEQTALVGAGAGCVLPPEETYTVRYYDIFVTFEEGDTLDALNDVASSPDMSALLTALALAGVNSTDFELAYNTRAWRLETFTGARLPNRPCPLGTLVYQLSLLDKRALRAAGVYAPASTYNL